MAQVAPLSGRWTLRMKDDACEAWHVHVNWPSSAVYPASLVVGRAPTPPLLGKRDICEAQACEHGYGRIVDAHDPYRNGNIGGPGLLTLTVRCFRGVVRTVWSHSSKPLSR